MNSVAVNKLIRSEIWPLLRAQGFTQFGARAAWRFSGWRTEVVNFQSFNSYHAEGIGCTTYSFAVNLGVHLVGNAAERWFPRDAQGRALPPEYGCSFRTHLQKRTMVDGFERPGIFYIDPEGKTTGLVFREVRELLEGFGLGWFAEHSDPEQLIASTRAGGFAGPMLMARLHMLRSPADEGAAREELERAIGCAFDFPPILSDSHCALAFAEDICRHPLFSVAGWGQLGGPTKVEDWRVEVPGKLWPRLRESGFQRFSKLTARRERDGILTMVGVAPMDKGFPKRAGLPAGLYSVWLGWADLRTAERPVPSLADCQTISWLRPKTARAPLAMAAFSDMDSVLESLEREGDEWLSVMAEPAGAMELLQLPDWELFRRYPLMRGQGAMGSKRRNAVVAGLARRCD